MLNMPRSPFEHVRPHHPPKVGSDNLAANASHSCWVIGPLTPSVDGPTDIATDPGGPAAFLGVLVCAFDVPPPVAGGVGLGAAMVAIPALDRGE
jgi:hypothetical protein